MLNKMKMYSVLIVLMSFFLSSQAIANESFCDVLDGHHATLQGGRVKPLGGHAKDLVKFIVGKSKWNGQSAMAIYCQMSLSSFFKEYKDLNLPIQVQHIETKKFLGIDEDAKSVSLEFAKSKLPEMLRYSRGLKARKEDNPFSKDLNAVIVRTQLYEDILTGNNWQIPFVHGEGNQAKLNWIPVKHWLELPEKKDIKLEVLQKELDSLETQYQSLSGKKHVVEWWYGKLHLFHWSILAVVLSLAIVLTVKKLNSKLLWSVLTVTFLLECVAIFLRVWISGRGPVTNMYETVMWVGIGGLFFALVLAAYRKEKLFLLGGLILNLLALFMMTFATDMLDPTIKPLVPVLRDNFWLSTHVTSITISYAAFGLSWVLANYYMIKSIVRNVTVEETKFINQLCYDCLKIGVVLLAAGIILGGVWADYSWGRFWGWDPKETWALIALMIYIAILHGRFAGWIKPKTFIPFVAIAFLSIMMAWFGVNYILAAGLHSYGFSEGGSMFLGGFFAIQLLIFALHIFRVVLQKQSAA